MNMMKFHSIAAGLLMFFMLLATSANADELVVVVNATSGIGQLTQEQVINIFLGRYRYYPSGLQAAPVDLPDGNPAKAQFYRKLINKEMPDVNAYWSRLLFSGRVAPPVRANSTREVSKLLTASKGAISYMYRSEVDQRFVVVYALEDI
ncbi:MAG: hypothetical protein WCL27_05350 [Betaproteobacteria bacterium]